MFRGCAVSILPDEIPLILVEPIPEEIKKQGPFPPSPNFNRVSFATGATPGAQLGEGDQDGGSMRQESFPDTKFCDIALGI